MRCKHCGKELPLFKKLADNDFCSAEHRELFVDAQHQLMLARLQESGRRMRSRLTAVAREPLVPPPPDPNPPPRPLFDFLLQPPALREAEFQAWLLAIEPAEFRLIVFPELALQIGIGLAARVEIPAIEYRSGIRGLWGRPYAADFEPLVLPPRRSTAAGAVGISGLQRLLEMPACSPRDWRGSTIRWAAIAPLASRPSRRIPSAPAQSTTPSWTNTNPLLASGRLAPSGSAFRIAAGNTASAANSLAPVIPLFTANVFGSVIPGMVSRLYRMRPRNPRPWPELPAFNSIPAAAHIANQADAAIPGIARELLVLGLRASHRPYRMRAGGPVGAGCVPLWLPLAAAPEPLFGFASLPPLPPASLRALQPRVVERLFRSRPRTGVSGVGDLVALDAMAGGFKPDPAIPGVLMPGASPNRVERMLKARPRAGINDARLPLFETVQPRATQPAETLRAIPAAACAAAPIAGQPHLLTRAFRMRPRAGVADPDLSALQVLNSAAVIANPSPSISAMPAELADCRPSMLDRPYRMRPRAGVACSSIAAHLPIETGATPVILHPMAAAAEFTSSGCAPEVLDRPYRMRPRAGIEDRHPVSWTSVPAAFLPFAPELLLPPDLGRTLYALDQKVPPAIEKLFRMRPRAGINDCNAQLQELDSAGPAAAGGPKPGAYPEARFGAAEVSLTRTERLFRMRPRSGVRGNLGGVLNRPEPLTASLVERAYPLTTAGGSALVLQDRTPGMPSAATRDSAVVLHTKSQLGTLAATIESVRPSLGAVGGCAPHAAEDLFPARRPEQTRSLLAPDLHWIPIGPVEDSEIFVMPPVPELHVVHEYDLPRSDRQTRIGPPTASAGSQDLNEEGAEPLDGAMVARVMLASSMVEGYALFRKAMVISPGIVHDPTWKRTLASIRSAFLGKDFRGLAGWLHAPVLRLATCGAGVLFTVILWSASYAPVSSATVRAGNPAPQATPFLTAFSTSLKQDIAKRSATDLRDDFASGVHDWEGDGDWSSSWSYDERGGVIPGDLAILKPSRKLADYTVEFLGQIEKKALGFTIRSADTQNYQAVKLAIKAPGPIPVISIAHYAVVAGTESARQEKRLPITVFNDTIYRIRLVVRDDTFTLAVNEQVVDAWSDNRIATGGVGFFAGRGERSRVYDVRVYHQTDALGKALALVANKEPQGEKGISQE